jgi:hypothetical protein
VSQSRSLRKLELECTRLAADCMRLADDVYSPAFQSQFLRMVKAWPILVNSDQAATPMTLVKRVQIFRQENLSLQCRDALTPMALVRQLKKLRQENASLRRRILMQTD